MSKNAKSLLKSLERSQETAAVHLSTMKAAATISGKVEGDALATMITQLEAYLRANQRMQIAVGAGYGDSPRQIALKTRKFLN